MVVFKEKSFEIHCEVGYNPAEEWLGLIEELLEVMALMDDDVIIKPWRLFRFLQSCMPEWEVAKLMTTPSVG